MRKEQNCVMRNQVEEEFNRQVGKHCESLLLSNQSRKVHSRLGESKSYTVEKETYFKENLYHSRRNKLYKGTKLRYEK